MGSVLTSRLRITDVDGKDIGAAQAAGLVNLDGSSANGATYSFDIQIGAAEEDELIDLIWNSDHTILKLTSTHQLVPGNTYKLDLLTNQAHSDTATVIDGPLPLILGPGSIQVSGADQFTMPSARFTGDTSVGEPFNLLSGFQFTTYIATGPPDQYPEVLWVTPRPGAVNVPTQLYLELGFSLPMDVGLVQASKLRITQTGGGSFTIPIQQAINKQWVDVTWSGTGSSQNSILKLTVAPSFQVEGSPFSL